MLELIRIYKYFLYKENFLAIIMLAPRGKPHCIIALFAALAALVNFQVSINQWLVFYQ